MSLKKSPKKPLSKLWSVLAGPAIFFCCWALLDKSFGTKGAQAIGTAMWIAFWWITRPVHIAVTGILPVVVNTFCQMVPMNSVISQYSCETIILLFGADLICLPWEKTGLDKRLSLKALCLIGPSLKQQIAVWLFARSLFFVLPNAVVCAILTPVAVKMLNFVDGEDISKSKLAAPILLAIAWGSGIGGAGSPLGGAMNLVSIGFIEQYTGKEFMYVDWIIRMMPMMVIELIVVLMYMYTFKLPVRQLDGTKEYFHKAYSELGRMKKGEIISLATFAVAMLLSFARPLYSDVFPNLKPAFIFLALGLITFFFTDEKGEKMLEWETVEKKAMWNMIFLYAGGLALGKLISETGAADTMAELIAQMDLDGGLGTIVIFVAFSVMLAEFSSNTAAAAIAIPVVMSTTQRLGLNPIPYWYISSMAINTAFILPITVRAIPISYGLDVSYLFKKGPPLTLICIITISVVGYLFMSFWPLFSTLS